MQTLITLRTLCLHDARADQPSKFPSQYDRLSHRQPRFLFFSLRSK